MAANSSGMKLIQLCDAVNQTFGTSFTYDQIKGYVYRNGLKFIRNVRHNILLTDEQAEYLAEVVPGRSSEEAAEMLNERFGLQITKYQVRGWKKNHKIPSGYDTRWRSGRPSWNKGKKGLHGSNAGTFKKGHVSFNKLPIGSIAKRKSGSSLSYWFIKTRDDAVPEQKNWQMYHKYLWEQANGPVPEGYVVIFLDGDRDNCQLSNLQLVPRTIHGIASTQIGYSTDPDVNQAVLKTAELIHSYAEREREIKENMRGNRRNS